MDNRSGLTPKEIRELQETTVLSEAQILRLHQRFKMLDQAGQGTITAEAFSSIASVASNPLLGRILAVLDTTGDGKIDFRKFAKTLAIFSPQADKLEKLRFTYMMYDFDGDGKISNKDLFETLKIMVGTNLTEVQLQQIVDKTFIEVDLNRDGYITFDEFEKLTLLNNFGDRLNLSF
ncbi:calcineurin B subunit [Trypanosoma rangeli]|uniref:Calcineurin B subunit n=1 Tax=Trypanosoma rangeli TaxID=5698 RepID=A0A422N8B8_TRYRA|nr:calcineurin B subunit [Trypanosoma rangeli]RNF01691.1 calcineurin B subunit [Trypanosoma rangeli]|eukprot:RNF01691.1 calcineurin B subunit [Trypanosoma rangeli]